MAEEPKDAVVDKTQTDVVKKAVHQPRPSILKRFWQIFARSSNDDFESRLKYLSKEEAAVRVRLKRRSQTWRKFARYLVLYCVIIELLILGIAIMATRQIELTWQIRALRVLPVFAFPAVAAALYSMCASYFRMRERNDQKRLDYLCAEKQAKINELKERTNYYLTQQLIQQYDSDPAAKQAAARVLASRLGAEAGLEVSFKPPPTEGEANAGGGAHHHHDHHNHQGVDGTTDSTGIRRRRGPMQGSTGGTTTQASRAEEGGFGLPSETERLSGTIDVDHSRASAGNNSWMARLAAMLVGEDPTQCYALICGNCHMHNGLARKEDYEYITYYCPHCQAFNRSHHLGAADGESAEQRGATDGRLISERILADTPVISTSTMPLPTSQMGESSSKLD